MISLKKFNNTEVVFSDGCHDYTLTYDYTLTPDDHFSLDFIEHLIDWLNSPRENDNE